MTLANACPGASYPIRHPDRPEEPALSLSMGAEGSRLGLTNKHRTSATGFLRFAALWPLRSE